MAKAVAARQFGDEYQQLVFWKYALRMLSGNYEIDNIKQIKMGQSQHYKMMYGE